MIHNFSTRQAKRSDWPHIQEAFARSFSTFRSKQTWDWRYHLGSRNDEQISCAVCLNAVDDIVGFVGGTVHAGVLQGRPIQVVIARDAFSVPNLVSSLGPRSSPFIWAEKCFHQHNAHQHALALGFGTQRRTRLGIRLGLAQPFTNGQWLGVDLLGASTISGVSCRVAPTDFSSALWNSFWVHRSPSIHLGIVRNQPFLHWRYHAAQGRTYWSFAISTFESEVPVGFVVLTTKSAGTAIVVDIACNSGFKVLRDALQQIQRWLFFRGFKRVEMFSSRGCPEFDLWPALGFQSIRFDWPSVPVFNSYDFVVNQSEVNQLYAMNLGDSDLF